MTQTSWKAPLVALVFALAVGLSTTACNKEDPATPGEVNNLIPDAGDGPDAGPGTDPDAGPGTDPDATTDPDVDPDPVHPGANFIQAATAGGTVEGGGYRAVIGVGAPVPRGYSAGGGYRVRLGPVSP